MASVALMQVLCYHFRAKMKIDPITKKGSIVGGGYSNRTRATKFNPTGKKRKYPNLQKSKVFVLELGKHINIEVTTRGMRTMKKRGIYITLLKAGLVK